MFIEYKSGLYINSNNIQSIELDEIEIKFRIKDGKDRVFVCTNHDRAREIFFSISKPSIMTPLLKLCEIKFKN